MKNEKLTKAQKRVLIARDVLKLLSAGNIEPEAGIYFRSDEPIDRNTSEQFQKQLPKLGVCTVCAIGATFYAQIRRFDKLPADALDGSSAYELCGFELRESLLNLFSHDQLRQIEYAFEATEHRQDFPDDEDRLRAIMKNLIANKGTFKPEPVPWERSPSSSSSASSVRRFPKRIRSLTPLRRP